MIRGGENSKDLCSNVYRIFDFRVQSPAIAPHEQRQTFYILSLDAMTTFFSVFPSLSRLFCDTFLFRTGFLLRTSPSFDSLHSSLPFTLLPNDIICGRCHLEAVRLTAVEQRHKNVNSNNGSSSSYDLRIPRSVRPLPPPQPQSNPFL